MRRQEAVKEVMVPLDYESLVRALPSVEKIVRQGDVIRFETHEIEGVWTALSTAGCRIADMELQNKKLLNTLFDHTKEAAL